MKLKLLFISNTSKVGDNISAVEKRKLKVYSAGAVAPPLCDAIALFEKDSKTKVRDKKLRVHLFTAILKICCL